MSPANMPMHNTVSAAQSRFGRRAAAIEGFSIDMLADCAQYDSGGFSRNGAPARRGVMRSPVSSMLYAMSYSRGSSGVQIPRSNIPMLQIGSISTSTSSGRYRASLASP
jgi:hypothetical protein